MGWWGLEAGGALMYHLAAGTAFQSSPQACPLRVPVLALVTELQELPSPCMKLCLTCSHYALVLYQAVWRACSLLRKKKKKSNLCFD